MASWHTDRYLSYFMHSKVHSFWKIQICAMKSMLIEWSYLGSLLFLRIIQVLFFVGNLSSASGGQKDLGHVGYLILSIHVDLLCMMQLDGA